MAYSRRLRHQTLRAKEVLPFYDGVFAVAFTLLAFSLPDRLVGLMGQISLLQSIGIYALAGVTVIIYWFKLRRLMLLDRLLQPPQLLLVALGLITVVLLPKLASLVLHHGVGVGNLLHWSLAQLVNTLCLTVLLLFNLVCWLYAASLRRRDGHRRRSDRLLAGVMRTQSWGMLCLLVLLVLELGFTWFDNQYFYLVPFILLLEELAVAREVLR